MAAKECQNFTNKLVSPGVAQILASFTWSPDYIYISTGLQKEKWVEYSSTHQWNAYDYIVNGLESKKMEEPITTKVI